MCVQKGLFTLDDGFVVHVNLLLEFRGCAGICECGGAFKMDTNFQSFTARRFRVTFFIKAHMCHIKMQKTHNIH